MSFNSEKKNHVWFRLFLLIVIISGLALVLYETGGVGRLFGTILLSFGGNFIRLDQFGRFFILLGVAVLGVFVALAYKDGLERLFREWHERSRRKKVPEVLRIDIP